MEVAAGTQLRMDADVSLIFLGPVFFQGSQEQPIVIQAADPAKPWGGIALQGAATSGSRWHHVQVRGGTTPRYRRIDYPAMINFHATEDVQVRHCRLEKNIGVGDLFHSAYVKKLQISDTSVSDASHDAFDLEFTEGQLRRIAIHRIGDEGLDFMGSAVQLVDSVVAGCLQNAISVGEESRIQIRNTLIADSKVGLLAKNASQVNLSGSLLYRNQTGVRVYTKSVRYQNDSQVDADVLYLVQSKQAIVRKDRDRQSLDSGRVQVRLPQSGTAEHLLRQVIGLADWQQLDAWLGEAS